MSAITYDFAPEYDGGEYEYDISYKRQDEAIAAGLENLPDSELMLLMGRESIIEWLKENRTNSSMMKGSRLYTENVSNHFYEEARTEWKEQC